MEIRKAPFGATTEREAMSCRGPANVARPLGLHRVAEGQHRERDKHGEKAQHEGMGRGTAEQGGHG